MAAGPLSRLVLAAGSVADDLNYVALADISRILDTQTTDYRIIGGLMVTALAMRWNLGAGLYRETLDADLGVAPIVARDLDIAGTLIAAGYQQVAGDRFERPVPGVPAGISGGEPSSYRAAIDVLVPAYTSRPRRNVRVGRDLVTTEVLGLQMALARSGRAGDEPPPPQRRRVECEPVVSRRSQRANPEGPRVQCPHEADRHRRYLALPGDLLCSRS